MRRALEQLLMRLLALVAERKPARRAPQPAEPINVQGPIDAPTTISRRPWRLPSAEEIDRARGECAAYALPHVKICRGPAKGCGDGVDPARCPDCYLVAWHDRRPSAEILASMERGDA